METHLACTHWGVCGGCSLFKEGAYIPYTSQLEDKEHRVRQHLAPFDIPQWHSIIPSPDIWYYRNKMEYAFGDIYPKPMAEEGKSIPTALLGLRESGKYNRIVPLQECLLLSEQSTHLLLKVQQWANEYQLPGYNRKRSVGTLRYLVIREGKNTQERMVVLVISEAPPHDRVPGPSEDMAHALQAFIDLARPYTSTGILALAKTSRDTAQGETHQLLWGHGTIRERLGDITYRVSPYSFFQSNTHGAERLHDRLAAWASSIGGGALLDLYCGSGAIGLALAKSFDRVVGIDTNQSAIEDARFNAEQNHLQNTEFVAEDTQEFLTKLPASKLSVQLSAVVIDPPRPGLHPKAMKGLMDINPPRIAYVSCNPESLARDLQSLAPYYSITSAQALDLFPHTPHVETLVTLEHR